MALVSVIIPVYNVEEYLNKCIESVINQTLKDIEIILVDDGSTDNSPLICDEWKQKDKRIKVIHQKNSGVTKALRTGINLAKSEYISFIDSDDWVERNFLEILYNYIIEHEADITQIGYKTVVNNKIIKYSTPFLSLNKQDIKSKLIEKIALNEEVFAYNNRWTKMYKKEIVKYGIKICPESQIRGEDLLMNMAAYTKCEKIVLLDAEPLYNYRMNSNSTTSLYNFNIPMQEKQFWQTVLDIAKAQGIENTVDLNEILQENYANYIFYCSVATNLNIQEKIKEIKKMKSMIRNKKILFKIAKKSSLYKKIILVSTYFNLIIIPIIGVYMIRKVK